MYQTIELLFLNITPNWNIVQCDESLISYLCAVVIPPD